MRTKIILLSIIGLLWQYNISFGQIDYLLNLAIPGADIDRSISVWQPSDFSVKGDPEKYSGRRYLINSLDYGIYYRQRTNGTLEYDISRVRFSSYAFLPDKKRKMWIAAGYRALENTNILSLSDRGSSDFSNTRRQMIFALAKEIQYRRSVLSVFLTLEDRSLNRQIDLRGETELAGPTKIICGFESVNFVVPINVKYETSEISTSSNINRSSFYWGVKSDVGSRFNSFLVLSSGTVRSNEVPPRIGYHIGSHGSNSKYRAAFKLRASSQLRIGLYVENYNMGYAVDCFKVAQKLGQFGDFLIKTEA